MTYVLIHGAASSAWHWHLLTAELESRGQRVVAVELPCDDDTAGWREYADAVVEAVGRAAVDDELVVVAHSLAGFTGPLVCERQPVSLLVLVAAMIPAPGESLQEWYRSTAYEWVGEEDVDTFFQDLPPELAAEGRRHLRVQSERPMGEPWPLERWPDVPTKAVIAREDLLFPAEFLRRVTKERLGFAPDG
jgi:pimeloyl-ACP methyl ester carboxylesterase